MNNDNQTKDIGGHLRALVEASKAPGADLEKLYDRAEAGILRTVPDKPLVVEGRVLQPERAFKGVPLPDWEPGQEKTGNRLSTALNDAKQEASGRDRDKKTGPDR